MKPLPRSKTATTLRMVILMISIILIILGVLDGEYELVRSFVRFICTSCLGLGG